MSTTTHPGQGGSSDPAAPLPSLGVDSRASTDAALIGTTSDTCSHCGAQMAPDQRYCVNCGERRGKPRFTVAVAAPEAETREDPKRAPRRPRRMTASAGTTLIAGVATLLLALGVGVLIGQDNARTPAPKTTIIVGSGAPTGSSGAASTGAAQTSTPATSSTPAGTSAKGSKSVEGAKGAKGSAASTSTSASAKAAPVSTTKATSAAAQQAAANGASKALGGANVGNPTAQEGSSCTAGTPGCQGGKQTSQLFGGG
ncbi:MAG: zinc ribbon domain-containing protein [Solirubrobacteraceae bacterium]